MFGELVRRREEGADGKRLVLAFDAGCMTCSELARRIEERVGDRLELRSLRDLQVGEWRRRALGEDAPWAPTLIEVRGPAVRAWTGPGMGIHLSRFLGPVASWRVIQVLGELGAAGASERLGDRPGLGALARAVSRREFLKGAGGAVVGAAVLAGFGWVPLASNGRSSTAQAQAQGDTQGCSFREPTYSYKELTGSERDSFINNQYSYNGYFKLLWDTFHVYGFKPRPDAARVVTVKYTTSGGSTSNAYDVRVPFERVGQQYPVLTVSANEGVANTFMSVFQRASETNEASRVDVYRVVRVNHRRPRPDTYRVAYTNGWKGPFPLKSAAGGGQEAPVPASSELIAPQASASEAITPETSAPAVIVPEASTAGASVPAEATTSSSDGSPCKECSKIVDAIARSGCHFGTEVGCGMVCFEAGQFVDLGSCEPQCGAAIAAVCAAGVPANKETACQPFCDHEELTGDELVSEARRAARSQDMLNVGPSAAWSAGMQVGTVSKSCTSGTGENECITFICHDPAAGCDSHFDSNNQLVVAPGSTAIKAVRHRCSGGNIQLAISYLLSDGRAYHYYEYDQPMDKIKTEAGRWEKEGGTVRKFRRTKGSHNGKPDKPVPTPASQTQGTVSTQQYAEDPCGGCSGSSGGTLPPDPNADPTSSSEYYLGDNVLNGIDEECVSNLPSEFCGACALLGRTISGVVFCALAICPIGICAACCNTGEGCLGCYRLEQ